MEQDTNSKRKIDEVQPEQESLKKNKHQVQVGTPIEYFFSGISCLGEACFPRTPVLDDADAIRKHFETAKAKVRGLTVSRLKAENVLGEFIDDLKKTSPVLVTGSSGHLGAAIIEVLASHQIASVGIDLVPSSTTNFLGCVTDFPALRKAGDGCKAVFHAGALHAPNLDYYSVEDFEKVNVQGTRNVLSLAEELHMRAVVFSSTTSLMNTKEVKMRSLSEVVVLHASVDYGTPRNIYGVTKKEAERICLEETGINIAILRCSRFFVEDAYDTSLKQSDRVAQKTNGNVKANEILFGVRASLDDMVVAHLAALARISRQGDSRENSRKVLGPLVVSSVSPYLEGNERNACSIASSFAEETRMYKEFGWSIPQNANRLYDSRDTWKQLGLSPGWNFERLKREFEDSEGIDIVRNGLY